MDCLRLDFDALPNHVFFFFYMHDVAQHSQSLHVSDSDGWAVACCNTDRQERKGERDDWETFGLKKVKVNPAQRRQLHWLYLVKVQNITRLILLWMREVKGGRGKCRREEVLQSYMHLEQMTLELEITFICLNWSVISSTRSVKITVLNAHGVSTSDTCTVSSS